ncbi:MAG: hypothetical protein V7675_16155 [Hyphomonas sp.]|uniref:hypothetical protein n=1 Tax=Hyphomonas sp. TaxID=87 RepID=UPI003003755F
MLIFNTRLLAVMALYTVSTPMFGASADQSGSDNPVEVALKGSKPIFDLRLRYETVDQAGFSEPADALTYRLRAGLETGEAFNTKFLVEFEHVDSLIDDFNSTINGKTAYPVVPDPSGTELNRFQLTNTSLPGTKAIIGRERIVLDDSRFVGNVGFRQNEQTFDAVRLQNTSFGKLTLDATYLNQVNRIFGDTSPAGRWHGDSYLLNATVPTSIGKLAAFAYMIDVNESGGINSSQTYGARLSGDRTLSGGKLSYAASFATQQEYGSSKIEYSAKYYAIDGSYAARNLNFGLGLEVLGGDSHRGFQTPLATLHKFQGWADKFLTTPAAGVEDYYASGGLAIGDAGALTGIKLLAVYHDFSAQTGGSHYGDEIDLLVTAKWKILNLSVKYADYQADEFATDTRKIWLEGAYTF